ncbi:MBL fold metallo-hydrolase [Candidatus Binatia bacterium]|nr:MBL fold metallo-hydrolase [Candidatus Binatia bacterium]
MRVEARPEGLHLPDLDLFLDPAARVTRAVLSHGHADHARALAGTVHATPETVAIARLRLGDTSYVPHAYGEPFELTAPSGTVARLTLLPSGHVLGSAMVLVEHRDERLLYTGDVKLHRSRTCAPAEVAAADVLVTEATFGLPVFRFPPVVDLEARIVDEARTALDSGEIPVFLGYALGKGPEIARILQDADIPVMLHGAVHRMVEVYRSFGVGDRDATAYERGKVDGYALIVPPSARTHPMLRAIRQKRVIAVTGWALLDASYDRYGADVLIPLSDHADWDELHELVARTGARRVLTTHGFAEPLAHALSAQGHDASALHLLHGDEE